MPVLGWQGAQRPSWILTLLACAAAAILAGVLRLEFPGGSGGGTPGTRSSSRLVSPEPGVPSSSEARSAAREVRANAAAEEVTTLTVLDPSGAPLPAARVDVVDEDGVVEQVTSAAPGRFELRRDSPRVRSSIVTCRGFVPETLPSGLLDGKESFELVLTPSGSLSGRVVRSDGTPAGQGMLVVARPVELDLDPTRALDILLAGGPPVHVTETRDDGSFVLADTHPDLTYEVFAGGRGWGSRRSIQGRRDAPIELGVDKVFAARLDRVDFAGARVRRSAQLVGSDRLHGSGDAVPAGSSSVAVRLATFPRSQGDDDVFFLGPADARSVGPVRLVSRVPGYDEVDVAFFPEELAADPPRVVVRYRAVAAGWGRVVVVGADDSGVAEPALDGATLRIQAEGGGPVLEFGVRRSGSSTFVEDVPFGTYRARIACSSGLVQIPPRREPGLPLDVSAEIATLSLPARDSGAVRLRLVGVDGEPYHGPAVLMAMNGRPAVDEDGSFEMDDVRFVRFSGPPYEIRGLLPGEYSVYCLNPRPFERVSTRFESFEVLNGEFAQVRVDLEWPPAEFGR